MNRVVSQLKVATAALREIATEPTVDPEIEQEPSPLEADEEEQAPSLNPRTALYVALVVAVSAVVVALLAPDLRMDGWPALVILTIIAIGLERVGIKIYGDTQVSAGIVALLAIGIIYGVPAAAVAAPVVVFAATLFTTSGWYNRLFDMGSYTLAGVAAAFAFHAIADAGSVNAWWIPAGLLATVISYGVNIPLVAGAVSLSTGERLLAVWRDEHQWIFPYYIVFGLLGLSLAAAYVALGIPGIPAFLAPPLMMRFALHQYVTKTEQKVLELKQKNVELETANHNILRMTREITETYDGTLEALVMALDARDRETKGHSFRVAEYVMMMARLLGVDEHSQEWIDMQRGALLHDVGKIGVPDYILHKNGPLAPEEWDAMKRHPHLGHEMLKDISFLSGASEIVHAHHERFDGKGYPRGVQGDELPLGARIFAAADAFDAMTSNRPYRKALPPEIAREELIRHSGTQFDPHVVQAFLVVYDEFAARSVEAHAEEKAHDQAEAA